MIRMIFKFYFFFYDDNDILALINTGKDWLQVTAEDQCGLVGQAEAVLVDPSCSNSGTLTDTRSAVPHARMQGLTGFQTRALSHASILKSPLCSDLTQEIYWY